MTILYLLFGLSIITVEIINLSHYKMEFFYTLRLYIKVRKIIEKEIPEHWEIRNHSILKRIRDKNGKHYEVYFSFRSKANEISYTSQIIIFNRNLQIVSTNDFKEMIKEYDSFDRDKIKSYNRDSILEKIGV